MNNEYKRVLYINLTTASYDFKIHEDLWRYIGGIGVSLALLNHDALTPRIVLSTGPLTGYFPYISKSNLAYIYGDQIIEKFGGGSIGGVMNLAGVDAIVFEGLDAYAKYFEVNIYSQDVVINELSIKDFKQVDSHLSLTKKDVKSDDYYSFGDISFPPEYKFGGVKVNIEVTKSKDLSSYYDYNQIYNDLLEEYKSLTVEPRNNPSCFGCPMGCDRSSLGEDLAKRGVLSQCLVSCAYAEEVFRNIPLVYSCLNSVGYNYHHHHLERLPGLVGELKSDIMSKISE